MRKYTPLLSIVLLLSVSFLYSIYYGISHSNNKQYTGLKYVESSRRIPIGDEMLMTDEKEYKKLLSQKFTLNQIKAIEEIIISNSSEFDTGDGESTIGLCYTTHHNSGKSVSTILIASKNHRHLRTLLHECCHALYFDNRKLFDSKYKDRWESLDYQFVSNYATTNIKEDFAETGAAYLSGEEYGKECVEKIKLFKEFYNETR